MKSWIYYWGLILGLVAVPVMAQTPPTGGDNIGGVSAPAGSFDFSPSVDLVGLNPYTGNATRVVDDISVASASEVGLTFSRYYNTRGNPGSQQLGSGGTWRHSYQWDFTVTSSGSTSTIAVVYPNGTAATFSEISTNVWTAPSPISDTIVLQGANYILTTKNMIRYVFGWTTFMYYAPAYMLTSIVDSKGQTTTLTYGAMYTGGSPNGTLTVTEPGGRWLAIQYWLTTPCSDDGGVDTYPLIQNVEASDGRYAEFAYTAESYRVRDGSGYDYYYTWVLSSAIYTDNTGGSYTYTALVPQGPTNYYGTYALSQATDSYRANLFGRREKRGNCTH